MSSQNYRIDELERKVKGGTLANSRAAKLERELESLRELTKKGFDPSFVSDKLDSIERGLADHEVRISGMEGSVEVLIDETTRAHARVSDVEKVIAEDRKVIRDASRRVDEIENEVREGFPLLTLSFSAVIAVISGWLWGRHDWSSSVTLGDQSVATQSAADYAISSWLFGVGVGFAALAISSVVLRKMKDYESNRTYFEHEESRSNGLVSNSRLESTREQPYLRDILVDAKKST